MVIDLGRIFQGDYLRSRKSPCRCMSLLLDNEVKLMIEATQQMGKLKYFPIVFDLCTDEMFEAVFMLSDFRKSIK